MGTSGILLMMKKKNKNKQTRRTLLPNRLRLCAKWLLLLRHHLCWQSLFRAWEHCQCPCPWACSPLSAEGKEHQVTPEHFTGFTLAAQLPVGFMVRQELLVVKRPGSFFLSWMQSLDWFGARKCSWEVSFSQRSAKHQGLLYVRNCVIVA